MMGEIKLSNTNITKYGNMVLILEFCNAQLEF